VVPDVSVSNTSIPLDKTLLPGSCSHSDNKDFVAKNGKRKAFHVGGNSSCRQHLRQHWDLYSKECKDKKIPIHHWATPRHIWKQQEDEKAGKNKGQSKLEFETSTGPREFTREGVVEAVAKLIATDDQVRD
jgi:hypothetical protein